MFTRTGIRLMGLLALLPLPVLRALGWALGQFLYAVALPRRRVARLNLALCFPELDDRARRRIARAHFVAFAQAWLDRSWLWHGPAQRVRQRLQIRGDRTVFDGAGALVLFAPHFVGLDAGWAALTEAIPRRFATIYMRQADPVLDAWMQAGRQRFGAPVMFPRAEGVRQIAQALGGGAVLYLLPDLDYGPAVSEFLPFFGVPAATTTSLSRFCRVGRARAATVVTRLTPQGYEVQLGAPWDDFPTADATADTTRMNRELEALVREAPAQYLWTHRRFKTRPPGEPPVY